MMGTTFEIRVVAGSRGEAATAMQAAFDEVDRVEALLSEWRETSEISEVNRQAGRSPVRVGPELFQVLERSVWAAGVTGGAFDATFASCGHLWSFREARMPDPSEIERCLPLVDSGRLRLDPEGPEVFLPVKGMRIGIAGIGKGYGVDRAAGILEEHGIRDYIVDGGGDIRLRGTKLGRPWRVGITDPRDRDALYATLALERGAIVSSGDYERFFERDGVRYHHILDPATGWPARDTVAVTVVAPTAMDADALATGLFVLGPERGLALAESLEGVEALFFDPTLTVRRSAGFPETHPAGPRGEFGLPDSPIPVDGRGGPG